MAKGTLNKVLLIGNIGHDPSVKVTTNGTTITNLSIATTDMVGSKALGTSQEVTEWHKIVLLGKLGELAGNMARKGDKVCVEGRIQTNKWENKEGETKVSVEILASSFMFVSNRPKTEAQAHTSAAPVVDDNFSDDIPF